MKNGTSIALQNEIEAGEAKHIYRTQCLDALSKCKNKENKLKNSNKINVVTVNIPYGIMTIYRKIKTK